MKTGTFRIRAAIVLALMSAALQAWAADKYPSKQVRIIVPFTPGGGVDLVGRTLATKLSEVWGEPVFVDNRPGATGTIGSDLVAKAQPDGYTLLIGSNPLTVNPSLFGKSPFDPLKDFAPITLVAVAPNLLVANTSVPANSIAELVALAKAKPGTLNYASAGNGTSSHLMGELFKDATHVDITHIPYKGNPEALTDVLGGRVQLMFASPVSVTKQLQAGKLKALAVTSATRYSGLSEVPTFAEAGYPAVVASGWYGVLATGGTPNDVITKLNQDVVHIVTSPDIKKQLADSGYEVTPGTPEQFRTMLRDDFLKWQKVIREANIHAD